MSGERTILGLIAAKIVLIFSLYICVFMSSPLNKFVVSGVTFALWIIIAVFPYCSSKQAAQGRPLWAFKKNFNPNQSILIVIFFTVVCISMSILSLMGLLIGLMTPFMRDKTYNLDAANLISVMSIAGFISTNALASYFGFMRYHKRHQPRG